jgi:hypothetical protein
MISRKILLVSNDSFKSYLMGCGEIGERVYVALAALLIV